MTNEHPEEDQLHGLEERLRSFRPLTPRSLRIRTWRPLRLVLAFGVVAGLCTIAAVAVYHQTKSRFATEAGTAAETPIAGTLFTNSVVTVGQLNAALCAGDDHFFQLLDKTSPYILQREDKGTALYELGKE